jgi:DNA-binding NarL/FixJ family response regulator
MTSLKGSLQPKAEAAKIASLSSRERAVIRLVGEGLSNQQIAQCLALSETTVRRHLTALCRKLGVAERLDLILYAYRHGLAQIPQ